jgi:hypothetical protein
MLQKYPENPPLKGGFFVKLLKLLRFFLPENPPLKGGFFVKSLKLLRFFLVDI